MVPPPPVVARDALAWPGWLAGALGGLAEDARADAELAERPGDRLDQRLRLLAVVEAGLRVFVAARPPMAAGDEVEHRQQRGEVLVEVLGGGRVMDAVVLRRIPQPPRL